QPDGTGAGLVDFLELRGRVEHLTARREVGTLDVATELYAAQVRVLEELDQRRADLAEVVGRDVRRHADGDAGRAVDQKVRDPRWQHDGLGPRAVVIRPEGNGGLIDFRQQLVADPREAALGVAHRGGAV